MTGPRIASVNVGRPRLVATGRRTVSTAIWKQPVDGRVAVRGVNLAGDDQADRSVHGGPDKAVYAYGEDDIRAWEAELGRELGPGAFGENLTVAALDVSGALIGERWRIGSVLLEVAQPRLPCFKLGLRMGDPSFVRRFAIASRPGAYLRIVEPGELGAGDAVDVDVDALPDHGVSSRLVFDSLLVDPGLLPSAVTATQLPLQLRASMLQALRG